MAKKKSEPRTQAAAAAPAGQPVVAAGQVVLVNKELPDREITAREDAVPHYKRSGWRVKRAPKATDDASTEGRGSNADDQAGRHQGELT